MSPHIGMAGTINQPAGSAAYSVHESIEVILRYRGITVSSDNQLRHSYPRERLAVFAGIWPFSGHQAPARPMPMPVGGISRAMARIADAYAFTC